MTGGLINDSTQDQVLRGRFTAQIPNASVQDSKKRFDEEIVVFIIGARSNQ